MYGPPPCCKRRIEGQGWSAQMYTAFGGVKRLLARMECATLSSQIVGSLGRLLPSTGFESAGFDLTVVPSQLFASKPGKKIINSSVAVKRKQRPVGEADRLPLWPVPPRP